MEIKESLDASKRIENTFYSLTKVVLEQREEICNLKNKVTELENYILELELRPPIKGGSLYQDAKESFDQKCADGS